MAYSAFNSHETVFMKCLRRGNTKNDDLWISPIFLECSLNRSLFLLSLFRRHCSFTDMTLTQPRGGLTRQTDRQTAITDLLIIPSCAVSYRLPYASLTSAIPSHSNIWFFPSLNCGKNFTWLFHRNNCLNMVINLNSHFSSVNLA